MANIHHRYRHPRGQMRHPDIGYLIISQRIRNFETGAFARGVLRKFLANCAPICAKTACLSFCAVEEECAKLTQICRKLEIYFWTILCKHPFSNAPVSEFLRVRVVETIILEDDVFVVCRKQVVLTKISKKFRHCIPAIKQGICSPENDKNDENHSSKMTVCQKHRFDNPKRGERKLDSDNGSQDAASAIFTSSAL